MDSLSDKNPLIKQIRRAVSHGTLTDDGYCIAEGPHLLAEAARSGREIKAVIASESVVAKLSYPAGSVIRTVSDRNFGTLSSTENSQGVLALVKPPAWTMSDLLRDAIPMVVILDGIQEPGNAGAILRACEAFGASGVIFLKGTANPYNPKSMRASAGSIFRLPIVSGIDLKDIPDLTLFAAMPGAATSMSDTDFCHPCAVVIGSEGRGVSPELAARATPVSIPTSGVESLNAAVAAGVLLYEANRQRRASNSKFQTPAKRKAPAAELVED